MQNEFVFKVEWYDEVSSLLKTFQLKYFEKDGTVELVIIQISRKNNYEHTFKIRKNNLNSINKKPYNKKFF